MSGGKMKPALELLLERERESIKQRQEMEDMMKHSKLLRSISTVRTAKDASLDDIAPKRARKDISTCCEPPTEAVEKPVLPKKTCNCKKSNCLKLYCECFQQGSLCGDDCNCQGCHNNINFESQRQRAIRVVLERNPVAFLPKVSKGSTVSTTKYFRGCRCRRSGCQKKYCECYQAGVKCGTLCRCQMCKNHCADGTHTHPPDENNQEQPKLASVQPVLPVPDRRFHLPLVTMGVPILPGSHRPLPAPTKRKLPSPVAAPVRIAPPVQSNAQSRLYPLQVSMASESSLHKICNSLVLATCNDNSQEEVNATSPHASPATSISSSYHGVQSPSADVLWCTENLSESPLEAIDRRSELHEKAVLQEFSVWLRNIATASVNHILNKPPN
ncbi:hypothetical protein THRCLA_04654 [Thraustotheca clavata]|uniref:CRC domain-containing protein n=1 Tax=Thraustotheca clavata TaxID=74557 RepID=A0A1V9ZYF0_9STRA|nr:hypothetical protein THRCLA_04654 [Thraustotheca clavata]